MLKSNEQALLTYLEELKSQTLSSIGTETNVMNFWSSGKYQEYVDSGDMMKATKEQVQFYIKNVMERLEPLQHRLEWLESQINEITNLKSVA
jgi:hypothetical protein